MSAQQQEGGKTMSNIAYAQLCAEYAVPDEDPPWLPACRDKRDTSAKKSPRYL